LASFQSLLLALVLTRVHRKTILEINWKSFSRFGIQKSFIFQFDPAASSSSAGLRDLCRRPHVRQVPIAKVVSSQLNAHFRRPRNLWKK
jgi:hypothetical protein